MSEISNELTLSVIKQHFSLPAAFVYYMAKNPPSPEVFHKLIRCCKYFWLKNPVITLNQFGLSVYDKNWITDKINGVEKLQLLKIENVKDKLWIHRDLVIHCKYDDFLASSLIPKIYRCDLVYLRLEYQTLSFDEFKKFTSSGSLKKLELRETTVKNDDGSIVPIEKLIELLPNLLSFDYFNFPGNDGLQTITSETSANLNKIRHFPKMQRFYIYEIPESFDFEAFFATPKVKPLINR